MRIKSIKKSKDSTEYELKDSFMGVVTDSISSITQFANVFFILVFSGRLEWSLWANIIIFALFIGLGLIEGILQHLVVGIISAVYCCLIVIFSYYGLYLDIVKYMIMAWVIVVFILSIIEKFTGDETSWSIVFVNILFVVGNLVLLWF